MANTITSIKRFIGTKFNEPSVQDELQSANFKAVEGPNGETSVEVRTRAACRRRRRRAAAACAPAHSNSRVFPPTPTLPRRLTTAARRRSSR
jgi:hypothetical protein